MKRLLIITLLVAVSSASHILAKKSVNASGVTNNNERLWYTEPARVWLEAIPLGNSRIGAMVYGGTNVEEIQLNEETFCSGGPHNNNSTTSLQHLEEVRNLIFEGKEREAAAIIDREFIKGPHGMKYLTLGSLKMSFGHQTTTQYERELDLQRAVSTTSYTSNNVRYTRTAFTSLADSILVINIKASNRGALEFVLRHDCRLLPTQSSASTDKEGYGVISTAIRGVEHEGIPSALTAQCRVIVKTDGHMRAAGDSISIEDASEATLLVSAATNYVNYHDVSGDADATNRRLLQAAMRRNVKSLLKRHIEKYQDQYNRVSLTLGPKDARGENLSTYQRLSSFYDDGCKDHETAGQLTEGQCLTKDHKARKGRKYAFKAHYDAGHGGIDISLCNDLQGIGDRA